jgi:hypothetical protein
MKNRKSFDVNRNTFANYLDEFDILCLERMGVSYYELNDVEPEVVESYWRSGRSPLELFDEVAICPRAHEEFNLRVEL